VAGIRRLTQVKESGMRPLICAAAVFAGKTAHSCYVLSLHCPPDTAR
jgi:hypothetical protein